jgi:hypothetical protein
MRPFKQVINVLRPARSSRRESPSRKGTHPQNRRSCKSCRQCHQLSSEPISQNLTYGSTNSQIASFMKIAKATCKSCEQPPKTIMGKTSQGSEELPMLPTAVIAKRPWNNINRSRRSRASSGRSVPGDKVGNEVSRILRVWDFQNSLIYNEECWRD